jgi:hypothetical protein
MVAHHPDPVVEEPRRSSDYWRHAACSLISVNRPLFPAHEHDALQKIVWQHAPHLSELTARVGHDWLEDAEVEALSDVTLHYFLSYQLGPDDEPLADAGILGDHLSALLEEQRLSFWQEGPSDAA